MRSLDLGMYVPRSSWFEFDAQDPVLTGFQTDLYALFRTLSVPNIIILFEVSFVFVFFSFFLFCEAARGHY